MSSYCGPLTAQRPTAHQYPFDDTGPYAVFVLSALAIPCTNDGVVNVIPVGSFDPLIFNVVYELPVNWLRNIFQAVHCDPGVVLVKNV